jgi:hypothetical protein
MFANEADQAKRICKSKIRTFSKVKWKKFRSIVADISS